MKLKNKNPAKVYRAAALADREWGLSRYKAMGWKVEPYEGPDVPNCLQFVGGQTCEPGGPLESMGHVIVSMSAEKYAEVVLNGEDGASGQAGADEIEDQIVDRRSGVRDLVRGLNGQGKDYFRADKNISRPELEEFVQGAEDTEDPF
jgi:hypothetical protein